MAIRINLQRLRPSYLLRPRGKNLRFPYLLKSLSRNLIPSFYLKMRYKTILSSLERRQDYNYIIERVNYYNKLTATHIPLSRTKRVSDIPNKGGNYNRDFFEFSRYFPSSYFVDTAFGDNTAICQTPSIAKSRPIFGSNENDVLLKLNKIRHFFYLNDKKTFASKENKAIFWGAMHQPHRQRFMEKFFNSPMVDCGDTSNHQSTPAEWKKPLITPYDHLKYKFIVCIEGNDVASNLKWVMSSNSLAMMPKPKFETWLMEGKLIPNVHYVEIRDDYADVEEKIRYYSEHVDEAEAILRNAHEFVDQFRDEEREDIISLLVLKKYFEKTDQSV